MAPRWHPKLNASREMSDHKRSMTKSGPTSTSRLFPVSLLPLFLALLGTGSHPSSAQALPTATAPGAYLSFGGTYSAFNIPYGQTVLGGLGIYANINFRRQLGFEAEARWSTQGQIANVHQSTYLIGPRLQFRRGNFSPYVKGLIGQGNLSLPYNYGTVGALVIAPGAGLDFKLSDRLTLRMVDYEYQHWKNFPYGSYAPYGVSFGLSWRLFTPGNPPTHLRR
jgi:opacity protein-like surface antigen